MPLKTTFPRHPSPICWPIDLPVEAELARSAAKRMTVRVRRKPYTDPDEAVEFVERTHCASLAVGVGTAHGVFYKGILILTHLKAIRSL